VRIENRITAGIGERGQEIVRWEKAARTIGVVESGQVQQRRRPIEFVLTSVNALLIVVSLPVPKLFRMAFVALPVALLVWSAVICAWKYCALEFTFSKRRRQRIAFGDDPVIRTAGDDVPRMAGWSAKAGCGWRLRVESKTRSRILFSF